MKTTSDISVRMKIDIFNDFDKSLRIYISWAFILFIFAIREKNRLSYEEKGR